MTTHFESKYSWHDAFYMRVGLQQRGYGNWDCADPVAHVILDVIEAQNELADAIDDFSTNGDLSEATAENAVVAAIKKRHAAAEKLMAVILDTPAS